MDKNIVKSVWRHKDIKVVFSEPSMMKENLPPEKEENSSAGQ